MAAVRHMPHLITPARCRNDFFSQAASSELVLLCVMSWQCLQVDRIAQQSSVEDFRALERKILDAVRRVPSKPQSPFQLFVADRVPVLARNAQELGKAFHAENLQRQLTEEFTNLPFESVQDLKNRVEADFHATMRDVLTFVRQVGHNRS